MISASKSTLLASQMYVCTTRTERAQMKTTPKTEISIFCWFSDGNALDNLMHPLAAELELVGDLG